VKPPRGLSPAEYAAWAHLAASVKPLPGKARPAPVRQEARDTAIARKPDGRANTAAVPVKPAKPLATPRPPLRQQPAASPPPRSGEEGHLDSHWDRRVKAGRLEPDLTLDLHGHTLDTAHARIMAGLDQARAMGARVVLVVAGRERPVDPADRMSRRGAIRAKLLDWLAASRHADAIAAVRRAHIRHGGEGALYLVLKRAR